MTDCCDIAGAGKPTYRCEKYRIEMCASCLKCKDPELYCKFRSACMIHFLEKERACANCETPSSRKRDSADGKA